MNHQFRGCLASSWCRHSIAPPFRWRGDKRRRNNSLSKPWSCHAVLMVRIRLAPAKSRANHWFLSSEPSLSGLVRAGARVRLATVHTAERMPLPPNTLAERKRDMARLGFVASQIRQIEEARQKRFGPTRWLVISIYPIAVQSAQSQPHSQASAYVFPRIATKHRQQIPYRMITFCKFSRSFFDR